MDEQQVQPQIRTTPYANPMSNYGSSILMLTSPKNSLYELELTYRGLRENKDGDFIKVGKPLMNEEGVNSVLGIAQSIINQVTILGNLNKTDIPSLMELLSDTLARDLMINKLRYEITDSTARDKIYFSTLSSAYITMKRAFEEGDRRFWKGSQQEIRTVVDNPNSKKGGLFSFMGWNK